MGCANPAAGVPMDQMASMTPNCHGGKGPTSDSPAPHQSANVEHHCPVFACAPDFSFTARVVRTTEDLSLMKAPSFQSDERCLMPHAPDTPPPKA
jgi:hypothetical protein